MKRALTSALLAGTALAITSAGALAETGVRFSVLPTAAQPAGSTTVIISGTVGTSLERIEVEDLRRTTSINTEGDITIDAATDTAIGKASVSANVNLDGGSWTSYGGALEFAPGLTLSGGFASLYKADGYKAPATSSMQGIGDAVSSTPYIGLEYAAGPARAGLKLYDADHGAKSAIDGVVSLISDAEFQSLFSITPEDAKEGLGDRLGLNAMLAYDMGLGFSTKTVAAVAGDAMPFSSKRDYLIGSQIDYVSGMFAASLATNQGQGGATDLSRDTAVIGDAKWTAYTGTLALTPIEAWTFAASYGLENNKTYDVKAKSATLSAKWSPVVNYDLVLAYNTVEMEFLGQTVESNVLGLGMWWKF